ncbi:MAG: ATP-binding cassette domain-containing protein [Mollicutes bacterium]|jgi:ABC-2 type transport system ATP-binding protein|nr:ATP-binding cassette domain-containing protein [Mollicutes bacterium]
MKLEVRNINKSFGDKKILKDVSFAIESGRTMGFLGRNGAGKTTTIRIIMDVFKPNSGEVLIDGKPFKKEDYKIGYLPEEKGMYQKVSLLDQLTYFAELKGMDKKSARDSSIKMIEKMNLTDFLNKPLSTLSKGNQQKFFIAQAIVNDPDILILDEPFGGLDPVNAGVLKDIIKEFISKKKIVVFSSHQMSHVEEFCDDVTFIQDGKIILSDSLKKIKKEMGKNKIRLVCENLKPKEVYEKLQDLKDIDVEVTKDYLIIECLNKRTTNSLLKDLLKLDLVIESFGYYEPSLETIFINLERGK